MATTPSGEVGPAGAASAEPAHDAGRTDGSGAPGVLGTWVDQLAAALGVDPGLVDIRGLLDLARDAAHNVDRPAAPLTTFLVGYAAARGAGGAEAIDRAARLATE